ncbi:MAG: hypothetical protein GKR89_29150 [Candidatus Latescibacteria bacterium]|nr:hypothetical protein [Candidatus Latescibacterota bacterium]
MAKLQVLYTALGLLLYGTSVQAFNVYRLGGQTGNPWPAAVSYEPGGFLRVEDGSEQLGGPIGATLTHPTWSDTLVDVQDRADGQWLSPFFLPDTLNLAQDGVRNRVVRGVSDNLATSGPCYNNPSQVAKARPMFDGDPTTAAFYTANSSSDPQVRSGFYVQNSVIDLGVDYPINRIRFFPRLGTDNPEIDQILGGMDEPTFAKETLPADDFAENFLPWFEITGANSVLNFASDCYLNTREAPWFRRISPNALIDSGDPRLNMIFRATENLDPVVDIRFPTQQYQWIAIRPLRPIKNWEIAEFEVYGEGYVKRAAYTTAVLDMGNPMAWGKIRWDGATDPDGRLFIRTRTGTTPDPLRYFVPSSIPGEVLEISQKEFERADFVTRSTALDQENWSFWSAPYEWTSGLIDSSQTATDWLDGTPILSPGPARYIQVQLIFLSSLTDATQLRQLEFQFSPPAAQQAVGEIWPLDAARTQSTPFTYSVRPTFEPLDAGFDRLEIFTLTQVDQIRSVRVDGIDYLDEFPPDIQADRVVVGFPRLQGTEDTFKLIEVEFDTHVVRYGTEFQSWIYDSQGQGVKQLVDPGNANLDHPGNALGVRTDGLGADLIADLSVHPNPFTPNDDGVNDRARFQFQLHEVSQARQLELGIYDLSGRRVRLLEATPVVRGLFGARPEDPAWDGRDDQGTPVPPGLYIYRLAVETDGETLEKSGPIAVAY